MKKRTLLQECLLSAAAIAVPGLCLAADHRPLQPVNAGSSLKTVPGVAADNTIQLAEFQPQLASEPRSSAITLVQHDTSSKTRKETKQPGFFKRLFTKRPNGADGSNSGGTAVSPGQPGVSIPKPPPIDFTMPGQKPKVSGGVPSRTASFTNTSPPTYRAAHSKDTTQAAVPVVQPNKQEAALPSLHSPVRSTASHDGFVSPFISENTPHETDTLLDLDSLIKGQQKGTTLPQPSAAKELAQNADKTLQIIAAKKQLAADQAIPEGPFTGYRLPSDNEVLQLQKPAPKVTFEPVPEIVANLLPEAVSSAVVEEPAETIVQVPLLEEPAMALPPVTAPRVSEMFELPEPNQAFARPVLIDPVEPQQTDAFRTAEASTPKPVAPSFVEEPGERSPSLNVMDGRARREQQRYRIMARAGKAGFKGFCPVALRDDRELLDSREQFKAKFGLQTYYFSSPQAKSAFESAPARYAPAGGGSDVVVLVNTGEETPGSLDFCLWYRDRLYLFGSRETQAMFSDSPRRYANQY